MVIDAWFPFYGGGQVHVTNVSQTLARKYGYSIELFYSRNANLIIRALWSVWVIIKMIVYHRHHPLDIIHSHGFISGIPAKVVSRLIKVPVVHTVHGSHLLDKGSSHPKAWLEKYILTQIKYDAQITVADTFLNYPNVNTNIVVIPNGVNIKRFDSIKVRKNRQPTLIWVGRDHPDKGVGILKAAIKKVRTKIPNLHTILVTGGKLSGDALFKAYKQSHLFVLPSLAEGQPITLLEAWAAKLPVVVTRVGSNQKMVRNNVNGLLIDPGSTQQLTSAILKVFRKRDKGKKMGLAGYRLVKQHYSWEQVAKQTHSIYKSLLK